MDAGKESWIYGPFQDGLVRELSEGSQGGSDCDNVIVPELVQLQ